MKTWTRTAKRLENLLKEKHTDLIVLAGFMTITNEKFTKAFENKIINVHPALIPSFCGKGYYGLHVHEAALARGVKVSGATVHFVNEVCDGRPDHLTESGAGGAGRYARDAAAPHYGAGGVEDSAAGSVFVLRG